MAFIELLNIADLPEDASVVNVGAGKSASHIDAALEDEDFSVAHIDFAFGENVRVVDAEETSLHLEPADARTELNCLYAWDSLEKRDEAAAASVKRGGLVVAANVEGFNGYQYHVLKYAHLLRDNGMVILEFSGDKIQVRLSVACTLPFIDLGRVICYSK